MSLLQIVASVVSGAIAVPIVRLCWRHGIVPWWRRHVRVRYRIELLMSSEDDAPPTP